MGPLRNLFAGTPVVALIEVRDKDRLGVAADVSRLKLKGLTSPKENSPASGRPGAPTGYLFD